MEKELKQILKERSALPEFKKSMGLLGSTTLGVGAMMGAGLYVLVGIAGAEAGAGLFVAYIVCGALTFLSVLMFAGFAKKMPISGGGYVYAYKHLGSFWGFMVGWHLAVGSIFACAMYAYGFASYALSFDAGQAYSPWIAKFTSSVLVILLIGVALKSGAGSERAQRFFTFGNLVVLAILIVASSLAMHPANFTPMFPKGAGGVGGAISIIYISFFGYQLIANNSEEVKEAERTVPFAMILSMSIAFVFYLLVAIFSFGVVNWKDLADSEAPLVLVPCLKSKDPWS